MLTGPGPNNLAGTPGARPSTSGGGPRWYVVYTKPHREAAAHLQLENQGFRAFLPCRWKTVRHARRLRTVRAPFFPRYLFVALDLACQRWRSVNGTIGVCGLIMERDRPRPVPPGLVEGLLASIDDEGIIRFDATLAAGQRVRLLAGPFADLVGELQHIDEGGRVRVLLELMGGAVRVWSRAEAVAPAG